MSDIQTLAKAVKEQQKAIAAARDALRKAIAEAESIVDDSANASDDLITALEFINNAIDTLSQQQ